MRTVRIAGAALFVVGLAAAARPAAAQQDFGRAESELACDAETRTLSMDAEYNERNRGEFEAEFEAERGSGYRAGQTMVVRVKNINVGSVKLIRQADGDVAGKLTLGRRSQPLPEKFPTVRSGTRVQIDIAGRKALTGC